jgi:hypothetical protein
VVDSSVRSGAGQHGGRWQMRWRGMAPANVVCNMAPAWGRTTIWVAVVGSIGHTDSRINKIDRISILLRYIFFYNQILRVKHACPNFRMSDRLRCLPGYVRRKTSVDQ